MVSVVVPGKSVTIEISFLEIKLTNDDFPVFGLPITETTKPSLMGLEILELLSSFSILFIMFLFCSNTLINIFFGKSSSEKSISASMFAKIKLISLLICLTKELSSPEKFEIAKLLCFSVSAFIKSDNPSVWMRSSLSFIKDLLVNSPGSASLTPKISNVFDIFEIIAELPWQLISTISSPVKEFGLLKYVIITWSIMDFSNFNNVSFVLFGIIFFIEDIFFKILKLSFPDTLKIAIADLPVGVDRA